MDVTKDRIGETTITKQGYKIKIVKYNSYNDIIVEFEDGSQKKTFYSSFKSGGINKDISHIGEINYNKQNEKMEIIEWRESNDILVKLEDNTIIKTQYIHFKNGSVKNYNYKSVCGVGYIGYGIHEVSKKGIHEDKYLVWKCMLERCYSKRVQSEHPTYIGCSVCEEWHCYQNFANWYENNYYYVEGCHNMQVDKDILQPYSNNKIYSPETCILVPNFINSIFRQHDISYSYIGISKASKNSFQASISKNNKQYYLGSFNNKTDAYIAYMKEKEAYMKEIANEYKEQIPSKLYNAMINYKMI